MQTQEIAGNITLKTPTELKSEEWIDTGAEIEIWKPINGFEGFYECSNIGRVRSLYHLEPMILTPLNNRGYLMVNLYRKDYKRKFLIHRLIAETFLPNPNNYPVVNHINGIRNKNNVSNIEWCNHKQNTEHAVRTGLMKVRGEDNKSSKLTWNEVNNMRLEFLSEDILAKDLCDKYHICRAMVTRILNNTYWYDKNCDSKEYFDKLSEVHKKRKSDTFHKNISKLTNEIVIQIRDLYKTEKYSYTDLSKKFNVTKQCIFAIIKYKTWKHI